jgi:hypothetical protein
VPDYAALIRPTGGFSCGRALAWRKEYSTGSSTTIVNWNRYEYDGINLLRVDEKYDTSGGSIDSNDPWRTLEVSAHRPGLLGKRVYTHTVSLYPTPRIPYGCLTGTAHSPADRYMILLETKANYCVAGLFLPSPRLTSASRCRFPG